MTQKPFYLLLVGQLVHLGFLSYGPCTVIYYMCRISPIIEISGQFGYMSKVICNTCTSDLDELGIQHALFAMCWVAGCVVKKLYDQIYVCWEVIQ